MSKKTESKKKASKKESAPSRKETAIQRQKRIASERKNPEHEPSKLTAKARQNKLRAHHAKVRLAELES